MSTLKNYYLHFFPLAAIFFFLACNTQEQQNDNYVLVDENATPQTKALYRNLMKLSKTHVMFGHQDAVAYGVGRRDNINSYSDVRDITGAYPAVYGWDIGHIAYDNNVDSVPFDLMIKWIKEGYERGGVITISWHELSPRPHKPIWSRDPSPALVLPGGEMHEEFRERLLMVGNFFNQLRDSQGRPIPVIFRPWHEHNGDWFWWCKHNATEQEYIDLWRYTVHFLRDSLQINHLLYAISPDRSRMATAHDPKDFLYGWPGDEYVDIIGLDNYWDVGASAIHGGAKSRKEQDSLFILSLRTLVTIAEQKNKLPALTETGNNLVSESDWFTQRILEPLKKDPIASKISYFLVWRNVWHSHYFAPYPGHHAEADFIKFYNDDLILFEDGLPNLYE